MKKAFTAALFSASAALTAFADEAVPELERPDPPTASAHPLADSVLPYVGIAVGLAVIAVILIVVINKSNILLSKQKRK